jgi:hypothetical protein
MRAWQLRIDDMARCIDPSPKYGGGVVTTWLLQLALTSTLVIAVTGQAMADVSSAPVVGAAQDLASRLSASPPVDTWVSDESRRTGFQADVNQMLFLSSLLAAELSNGKSRDQTRTIYHQLQQVGVRILTRSRAAGERLPPGEIEAYEALMSQLQAYYGPVRPAAAQ